MSQLATPSVLKPSGLTPLTGDWVRVWSRDLAKARRVSRRIEAGMARAAWRHRKELRHLVRRAR